MKILRKKTGRVEQSEHTNSTAMEGGDRNMPSKCLYHVRLAIKIKLTQIWTY